MYSVVSSTEPTTELEYPASTSSIPATSSPTKTIPRAIRGTRVFGLIAVLATAVISSLITSLFMFFGGTMSGFNEHLTFTYVHAAAVEVAALLVLFYVLRQNGTKLRDIGLDFRWGDVKTAIALIIASGLAAAVAEVALLRAYQSIASHSASRPSIPGVGVLSPWIALFVVINPFFEEAIVRAFMISEVVALTGSSIFAVSASVILQTAYHLYQGIPYALTNGVLFLVFSIYYVRTRRAWPIILAHFWFDFSAMFLFPMLFRAHV
jgi:membrane protease YdiL (CAAX protease family)